MLFFFFMTLTARTSLALPSTVLPRHSYQLPLAYDAIHRVRIGLALTRGADGTFGRPHLPDVDAIIREYCNSNVSKSLFAKEGSRVCGFVGQYAVRAYSSDWPIRHFPATIVFSD